MLKVQRNFQAQGKETHTCNIAEHKKNFLTTFFRSVTAKKVKYRKEFSNYTFEVTRINIVNTKQSSKQGHDRACRFFEFLG